jgi:predicted DNA-binding protein (MmcQ/YjbR family)
MNIETFREYCLSKKGSSEALPFDENILVFKVLEKIFALTDLQQFESINLKCEPEKAVQLREQYTAVLPGYHMNKKHWNTILMNGSLPDSTIRQWVDHSYDCVVSKMTKKEKDLLRNL